MTLMFYSGVILWGEIRCQSLLGVRGLTYFFKASKRRLFSWSLHSTLESFIVNLSSSLSAFWSLDVVSIAPLCSKKRMKINVCRAKFITAKFSSWLDDKNSNFLALNCLVLGPFSLSFERLNKDEVPQTYMFHFWNDNKCLQPQGGKLDYTAKKRMMISRIQTT